MADRPNTLELAPERPLAAPEPEKGFWGKLKRGLFMTHNQLIEKVSAAVSGRASLDEATLEQLEELLLAADLGVKVATEVVERVRRDPGPRAALDGTHLRARLGEEIARLLASVPMPRPLPEGPAVTLVVGVNGVGKTTSIAKLAQRYKSEGHHVLLAAADTFRAAAIDQLALWGERLGVEVIRQGMGSDPAAVVFDALQAARARGVTRVLIDTAGRLHTKEHLMAELAKVRRVVDREAAGWAQRTLLVLDATTGQNALSQAQRFQQAAQVDGVLLAKLDGTAKGGMAVALACELRLPILYLGVGEGADDLIEFRSQEFASALVG